VNTPTLADLKVVLLSPPADFTTHADVEETTTNSPLTELPAPAATLSAADRASYVSPVFDDGEIEALFISEVVINGGDIDPGLLAYLTDRRILKSQLGKDISSCLNNALFGVGEKVVLFFHSAPE